VQAYAAELRRNPIRWDTFLEYAKRNGAPREYIAKYDTQCGTHQQWAVPRLSCPSSSHAAAPTPRLLMRMPDTPSKAEELSAMGLAREAADVATVLKVRRRGHAFTTRPRHAM
jgi:hypothetical protein